MTAVNEIERATSPLAKEVSIFEVTPPGAAAIIITPIASSGEMGQTITKIKAITGSKTIWLIAPTKKSFGCLITLKKSALVNPRPKANIIKAKAKGKKISVTAFIKFITYRLINSPKWTIIFISKIAMKFDPIKINKLIQQNYSHLMPDFFVMQTEYLASLNVIYDDLDAALVGMVITNKLYKNSIKKSSNINNISFSNFYNKNKYILPIKSFKIKEISSILNLPRETVRRKKEKLIHDKIIIIDKKNQLCTLNTTMIDRKILEIQIYNVSKFLSKFSIFFAQNKFFVKEVNREQIKKDIDEKFLLYMTKFLDFQIAYFSNLKCIMDIESAFITLLCGLNTLNSDGYKNEKPLNIKNIFYRMHMLNDGVGLNATSISEITNIPRTTVLRKIANLEKIGLIKKDKYKRYRPDDYSISKESSKIVPAMENNQELLGIFFSQCLETYSART